MAPGEWKHLPRSDHHPSLPDLKPQDQGTGLGCALGSATPSGGTGALCWTRRGGAPHQGLNILLRTAQQWGRQMEQINIKDPLAES